MQLGGLLAFKTTLVPSLQASVSVRKVLEKSDNARTKVEVIATLSVSNAS